MLKLSINTLLKFLLEKKYEAKLQEETGQIYLIFNIKGQSFPVFIRVVENGELLQLLMFMPCDIRNETNPDLARLLHLINKELDIPGFGMDEIEGIAFYRIMVPTTDKKIEESIVDDFLKSFQTIAESFFPVIVAMIQKMTTFEEVLEKATNERQKG